jgi:hypothetical protein
MVTPLSWLIAEYGSSITPTTGDTILRKGRKGEIDINQAGHKDNVKEKGTRRAGQ